MIIEQQIKIVSCTSLKVPTKYASGAQNFWNETVTSERHCHKAVHFYKAVQRHKGVEHFLVEEVYGTLGRSSGTKSLLGVFGVTDQKSKVNLLMPGVPQCFLAHASPERLTENARSILEQLAITATKPRAFFLAVDETCWHRTYMPVVGLQEPGKCCIVGGAWHKDAAEDYSVLKAGDTFPPDKLSSLTVNVIASGVESNSSLWCVAAVPMPPGSTGKSLFFLALMGQIAESFVQENRGYAPAGFACDAGTANMLLVRTTLGLTPTAVTETVPFFKHCSYQPLLGFKFMPFQRMLYKGTQVVHCSGQRSVQFGDTVVDYSIMLKGGIPLKSFVLTDNQSDKQALDRFNPGYSQRSWLSCGVCFIQLLSALVSSASEGSAGIAPDVRVTNASIAYFVLLMGLAQSKLSFQQGWELHFLPLQRIRNVCFSLVTMILVTVHSPGMDPSKVQEKCVESWFGRCKAAYRGNPSIRDSIYSQHMEHLKQVKAPAKGEAFAAPELSMETAAACVDRGFQTAAQLLEYLSYKVPSEQIVKNFKAWWKSEGHEMMTQGSAGAPAEEDCDQEIHEDAAGVAALDVFDEEAHEIDYEAEDAAAMAVQQNLDLVTAAEDHAAVKAELAALHDEATDPVVPAVQDPEPGQVVPAVQDPDPGQVVPAVQDPEPVPKSIVGCGVDAKSSGPSHQINSKNACWLSFPAYCTNRLQRELLGLDPFNMSAIDAWTADRTLERQQHLMGAMRQFAASVRQREGILSRTAVTGAKPASDWNLLQSQLARGRAATLIHGGRQSRSNAWMAVQDKVVAATASVGDGSKIAWRPDHMRPDDGKQAPQVVAYLDGQKKVQVGVVASIWRGAVTKKDGTATRRMRATSPLPLASTAVIRVARCTKIDGAKYFTCGLSEISLMDPLDTVLCELLVAGVSSKETKLVLKFGSGFAEVFEKISENPKQWLKAKASAEEGAEGPEEMHAGPKVWVCSMFSRSMSGTRCIEDFFQRLPAAYKAAGFEILDDQGMISVGAGASLRWDVITCQAAEFFDVSFAAVSNKNFGKSVLAELAAVFPKDASAGEKLRKLCSRIDAVATPASLNQHIATAAGRAKRNKRRSVQEKRGCRQAVRQCAA
ncbi:unnamed protein product [Symbiodinium sp. CCMP2592]|nr:unnamed protein product [Symbiodinium sp. CCMP2592]